MTQPSRQESPERGHIRFSELSPWVRWLLIGLLVAAVVVLAGYIWRTLNYCAPDVERTNNQCVGITDGTDGPLFGDESADALRYIGEENVRIGARDVGLPVVTVAYVVPIPPPGVEDAYATLLARDLMGVAVAQRRANRTNTAGDRPLIRILLVNLGDSANPAQEPVDKLIEMTKESFPEHRLMAVAISGKSLEPLITVLDALVRAEVPVVVANLTPERVTSIPLTPDTSLARVSPTAADEAAAAAAFVRPFSSRALIVQNSDLGDRYAQTLGAAFRARYPDAGHKVLNPDESYNGWRDGAANRMRTVVRGLCQQRPDVVFFAGRAREMESFVAELPSRPCLDHPVRVITGDDGAILAAAVASGRPELRAGLEANASVYYAALARPEAWQASPSAFSPGAVRYLTGHCPECFPTLFPHVPLGDSYAIMAYDAVMTAVAGIRSPFGPVETPGALIQEFKGMHGPGVIPGASGWISLTASGATINKATPIMSIGPDGTVRFERLSSPDPSGTPCTPDNGSC